MYFEIADHLGAQAVGVPVTNRTSQTTEETILACLNELNTLCRSRFWDVQRQGKCRSEFESLRRIFLARDVTGTLPYGLGILSTLIWTFTTRIRARSYLTRIQQT